jgi:hypothetical protein
VKAEPSRDQLRTIIDTIPTLAWSTRADGTPEFFNRRWLDYTGLAISDALAGKWLETMHPDDYNSLLERWNASVASGEPLETQARQRRADGEYRWFLIRSSALRDEFGNILRWFGTNTDVDDWYRAKESARSSERDLQLILDNLPALIYTQSPEGETKLVNRRLLEYFGRPIAELQNWGESGVVHADDLERVVRESGRGVSAGEPYSIDVRLCRFDNVYRWFQCRHIPVRDAEGRIARWYGLGADIDDLERAADALRSSEQSWRLILDNIPGLVYTMTPSCELELVNRKVLEYFGRTLGELKDWERIGVVHPDDVPRVRESLRRARECGEPHEVEHRLRRSDGVYRWFKPRTLPMHNAHSYIVRWYCLLTDIDDLKRAEESLRSTQERLNRAARLATVSELSAAIAHEVNQPLGAVVANAQACRQWLSCDPPNIERALRSAELAMRDGNSAAEVIRRIRSLFKQAPLVKQALDMDEVIDELCNLMSDDLRGREIELEKNLKAGSGRVVADRVQVQQVLANLLRNGVEALDTVGNRPKRLRIASWLDGEEIIVLVTDNGVGIGDTDVFESFYTTRADGLGIGLSICRSIIDAHGGRLWVRRNSPHGSTFGFALRVDDPIAGSDRLRVEP